MKKKIVDKKYLWCENICGVKFGGFFFEKKWLVVVNIKIVDLILYK